MSHELTGLACGVGVLLASVAGCGSGVSNGAGDSNSAGSGGTASTLNTSGGTTTTTTMIHATGGTVAHTDGTAPSGGTLAHTDATAPSGGTLAHTDATAPSGGTLAHTDATAPSGGTQSARGGASNAAAAGSPIGIGGASTPTGGNGPGTSRTTASAGSHTTDQRFVFSPYKDTSINLDWNTNVITTRVSGSPVALATDATAAGAKAVTLAFATGECGSESWGGVSGAAMATANVPVFNAANVDYILSTGGAAGLFTCGSDSGFATFLSRWASDHLVGIDFDIEAGQTQTVITDLIRRIRAAHDSNPKLRFSLTLATLGNNDGATTAHSLGAAVADGLNVYGAQALAAVKNTLGWTTPENFPSYLTVNLMTMDYGATSPGNCVVNAGACDMGQSAIQAAYNLHDRWGVPFANIELTPMIGGNDTTNERFTLTDVDTIMQFAAAQALAGVHYWSYDRDVDCPPGSASPTCNTLGGVGPRGFLARFVAARR